MTIYDFARACMRDAEFNKGGIVKNEKKYLDGLGIQYHLDEWGNLYSDDENLDKFYNAMYTLLYLKLEFDKKGEAK